MQIETVAIESLSLDPANLRKHGQRNLDAIGASLRRFGQQKPIVVNAQNVVLAGNGTLTAARAIGWKEIKIVRSELAGTQATAFGIADNRSAELAEWDDNLADVLASLKAEDFPLADIGFEEADLERDKTPKKEVAINATFEVVAECESEEHQQMVYNILNDKGIKCRLLTL